MNKAYMQHVPSENAKGVLDFLRLAFDELHAKIEKMTPPGRYRSLALTDLEAAAMWATKAVVHADPDSIPVEPK